MRRLTPTLTALLALSLVPALLAPQARADEPRSLEAVLADFKSKDFDTRRKAAEEAVKLQDSKLVRPLARLLKDDMPEIRDAAIRALGAREVDADKKKAAAALVARVPRKGGVKDPMERVAIFRALRTLARRETIRPLMDGIHLDTDEEEAEARLMAVAEVPHAEAVDRLIAFLASGGRKGSRKQRGHAERALRYATGVNFGRDPDKWRKWWKEMGKNFSFESVRVAREAAEAKAREKREKREQRKRDRKKGDGRKGGKQGDGQGGKKGDGKGAKKPLDDA